MRIEKAALLASVVLAALLLAVPAVASAKWLHNGAQIKAGESFTDEFHGFMTFDLGAVLSFGCTVEMTVKATPGNTSEVTAFTVTTSSCVGGGAAANCKMAAVHGDTATTPWSIHTNTTDILTLTDVTIQKTYERINPAVACALEGSSEIHWPELTMEIIGNTKSIKEIKILQTKLTTNNLAFTGTLVSTAGGTLGVG